MPSYRSLALQSLVLICMTIVAHVAIDNALSRWQGNKRLAIAALALVVSGMLLLGASGFIVGLAGRRAFHLAAMGGWVAGAMLLLISRRYLRPRGVPLS